MNRSLVRNPQAILELTALLEEALEVDLLVSSQIVYMLNAVDIFSDEVLGYSVLLEEIDQAKKGSNAARQLLKECDAKCKQIRYFPPELRAYFEEISQEPRKKREEPITECNRRIARTIYQVRRIFSRISHPCPYTDPKQIDAIEQADKKGLAQFFQKEHDFSEYSPFIKHDPSTFQKIYKKYRRGLIIFDLATFTFIKALSDPAK